MENFLFFLAGSLVRQLSFPRKFKTHFIGDTGCSALLFPMRTNFKKGSTDGGDDLYAHEFREDDIVYGLICIRFSCHYEMEHAEKMLSVYLKNLKMLFQIPFRYGIEKISDLNHRGSIAVNDYWQDKNGRDWKVKGYTNGKIMSVLYVRNIAHTEIEKTDSFLDGFHFDEKNGVGIPAK